MHSELDDYVSDCDCDCQNNPEFEVVSSNSCFNMDDSTDHSSDSAVLCDYMVRFENVLNVGRYNDNFVFVLQY